MEWIDIKNKKPNTECGEYIIAYVDVDGVKTSGGAWWNGRCFEDWSDNEIESVLFWMEYPEP